MKKDAHGSLITHHSAFILLYNMFLLAAWPVLFLYYLMRTGTDGKYRGNYLARMGMELPVFSAVGERVWIHALSVGEVQSVIPLVKALKEAAPHILLVFSTATETGQAIARKQLAGVADAFFYLPHDFPWAVASLVEILKPSLFILVETDIWPNLMRSLKKHRVPACLVNGRISETSFRRWKPLRAYIETILNSFDTIFAQSEEDKKRYEALGASVGRVEVAGNLKFDSSLQLLTEAELSLLRNTAGIDGKRPVWIAGSTHEGEEEGLLRVHAAIRRTFGDALLILAPRRIERSRELLALCRKHGFRAVCRSGRESAEGSSVYILDTLGELKSFYALAKAAFIGGSMVPFGGHNPLEAFAQGKPVFWGPYLFNFREIEDLLLKTESSRRVSSEKEMEDLLIQWLGDGGMQTKAKDSAADSLASFTGVSQRIAYTLIRKLR